MEVERDSGGRGGRGGCGSNEDNSSDGDGDGDGKGDDNDDANDNDEEEDCMSGLEEDIIGVDVGVKMDVGVGGEVGVEEEEDRGRRNILVHDQRRFNNITTRGGRYRTKH